MTRTYLVTNILNSLSSDSVRNLYNSYFNSNENISNESMINKLVDSIEQNGYTINLTNTIKLPPLKNSHHMGPPPLANVETHRQLIFTNDQNKSFNIPESLSNNSSSHHISVLNENGYYHYY